VIFNTSYTNKNYNKESVLIVGKAYSIFSRIKLGGIGSSRLIVHEFSEKLQPKNTLTSVINYANIELRPKGIILHFKHRLDRFSWIIPFYRLNIYNAQYFSIYANGSFIKFRKNKNYNENKRFIEKLIDLKNESLNLGYYDS